MFHEWLTAPTDMAVLPGVLGCRTLRTYHSGTPRIQRPAAARWHRHLHGLATAIHETSGLIPHPQSHISYPPSHIPHPKHQISRCQVSGTSLQLTADSSQLVACSDDSVFRISFSCQLPAASWHLPYAPCRITHPTSQPSSCQHFLQGVK